MPERARPDLCGPRRVTGGATANEIARSPGSLIHFARVIDPPRQGVRPEVEGRCGMT